MKINLKLTIGSAVVLGILSFGGTVLAATPKEITKSATEEISDSQIVQVLPEGGFISNIDGSSTFRS